VICAWAPGMSPRGPFRATATGKASRTRDGLDTHLERRVQAVEPLDGRPRQRAMDGTPALDADGVRDGGQAAAMGDENE
jgi:hypothetical protein